MMGPPSLSVLFHVYPCRVNFVEVGGGCRALRTDGYNLAIDIVFLLLIITMDETTNTESNRTRAIHCPRAVSDYS